MVVIGVIFCIITAVIIILLVTSKVSYNEEIGQEKKFTIPPPKRYPFLYVNDCHFYQEPVSNFIYSEEEIDQFLGALEDSFNKGEYVKVFKLSSELIKILPKADKVWLRRINSIFLDVIKGEKCWDEKLSKLVINACFGLLQCYSTVIEKSMAARHILLPLMLNNITELINYQNKNVTKYHNLEVYNMLFNLYHVIPYRDILVLMSNNILEDKIDKDFSEDSYVQQTLKTMLKQADIIRTRNTSRLQETFNNKKITNCTLISDDRIGANIVAFELNFEPGTNREKIEAIFYDSTGKEMHLGENEEDRYIDVFEANSNVGGVSKQEIVLLTSEFVSKVGLSIYKDKNKKNITDKITEDIHKNEENIEAESAKIENSEESTLKDNNEESNNSSAEGSLNGSDEDLEAMEDFKPDDTDKKPQILMYPSFDQIKDIALSDTQFVGLKDNDTVIVLGTGDKLKQQINSWSNIYKIYVKDEAVYGVRNDGTVIYAGNSNYEGIENIYSWENIESLSLGETHMVAITKNATMYAVGENLSGECNVEDWYDIIQVATAYHTVGLTKSGEVWAVGENNFGECNVQSWQNVVQVAVGDFFTLGLTSAGKVLSTGLNSCGQCNVSEWANIKKIFAKGNVSVGLRYDGKVVIAGKNSYYYGDIKNWEKITNIVMSNNRIVGIEQDGTIRSTGKPFRDFVNGEWENIKNVAINGNNIVALKEDGKLISNILLFGQCITDNFDNIVQICEDLDGGRIATVSDKGVVTINDETTNIENIENLVDSYPQFYEIKLVDMSKTHIAMLKDNGTVSIMKFSDRIVEEVENWENIIDVEVGEDFTVGLDISGRVVAKGDDNYGQCDVTEWVDIVKIRANGKHAVGLSIDGKLYISGLWEPEEKEFIKKLRNIKDFAMSSQQVMILEADGTVKVTHCATGINVDSISMWKNIKKVVARGDNFLGLSEEGKVFSTIADEVEIGKWEKVEDIDASGSYVWAKLKE